MKKVLVTGANGMLGSALCNELGVKKYHVYLTDINTSDNNIKFLDITDRKNIDSMIQAYRPDFIFHLAAETDVDRCEREKGHAYSVNVDGTRNIAEACQKKDITMIYISTSGIFDGHKKNPYTELDEPHPINTYAKTKWEGEKVVKGMLKRYFIVRAGWMFGGADRDKKFVWKIIELLKTQRHIRVVNDKFGSPTFTDDLSGCMSELIETAYYDLYHIANEGWCSRYDMACKIVEYLGLEGVVVEPVSSDAFALDAARGNSEAIDSSKFRSLGFYMRPWQDALREYITRFRGLFNNEKQP